MNYTNLKQFYFCLILSILCYYSTEGQESSKFQGIIDSIALSNENKNIEIGFGIVNKTEISGSVYFIDSSQFNKGMIISPLELIIGRVPGLSVSSVNGVPGSRFDLINRGIGIFHSDGTPLIMLDGMIVTNDLAGINPNDIASFSILKDVATAGLFGEDASNGAIIMTTKKGRSGIHLEYTGKFGFSYLPHEVEVFSAAEFRSLINSGYANSADAATLLGNANTNWQNEIYQTAFGQEQYVGISGTLKTVPFRISFGNTSQEGILKTSAFRRTTTSISVAPKLFDNHLNINVNLKGTINNNQVANENAISNALHFDPTQPVYAGNEYGGYFTWTLDNFPNRIATKNPVALMNLTDNKVKTDRVIGNIKLDYNLHFFPAMHIVFNYGIDNFRSANTTIIDTTASWTTIYGKGYAQKLNETNKNSLSDIYLNYSKQFEDISSKISVIVGFSSRNQTITSDNFESNQSIPVVVLEDSYASSENKKRSEYAGISYSLLEKYILNATLRRDGSSKYESANRFAWFPAISMAWNLHKEQMFHSVDWVTELKLRAGCGSSGAFQPGQSSTSSNLIHEKISSLTVGVDYGFFKNRMYGNFDFYIKKGNGLLLNIPIPTGGSFSNYLLVSAGSIENKGIELNLNALVISKEDWNWNVGFNASLNKNKILSLGEYMNNSGLPAGIISTGIGNTIQIQTPGYPVNSYFVFEQVYDRNGAPIEGVYVDRSGNGGVVNSNNKNLYHYQKPQADVLMGISSGLNYKNMDFSFSGRVNLGNYMYNNLNSNSFYNRLYNSSGFLTNITTSVNQTQFSSPQYFSDYYIQNASFFRMDYMSLGYSLNTLWKAKLKIHFGITAQNVFVLTRYEGQDPESVTGIENYNYPRCRTISLELNVGF